MNILPIPLTATENPKYDLLEKQITPGVKASLDIQVSRRIGKEYLFPAARALRESLCKLKPSRSSCEDFFPRIFIDWYLPGMEIGAGAWATTHFEPELTVKIMDWMLEFNPPTDQKNVR